MADTQRPTPVSVNASVQTQTPEIGILPDSGTVRRLQGLHPKYERANTYAFRSQFLNNADFRNQYLDDVIGLATQTDPQLAADIAEDPDLLPRIKSNMLTTYTRDLYKDATTGEDIQDAIVKRASFLGQSTDFNKAIPEFQNIVATYPDNYSHFGLSDGKKPAPILTDKGAFGKLVASDPKLREQLYTDKYNTFYQTLGQLHNVTGVNLQDPDDVAKAYAVYDSYGPEALTMYINYTQKYMPGEPLEAQRPEVQAAYNFFNTPDRQGRNPSEVIERFIGSPESPEGQLVYTPKTESKDLTTPLHLDTNQFTAFFHTQGTEQGAAAVINRGRELTLPYSTERINNIVKSFESGVPTQDAEEAAFDIMARARNNDGWTMYDLIDTIANNSQGIDTTEDGVVRYTVDPSQLNTYSRLALEALQMDATYGAKMFTPGPNGTLYFEPERQERLQSDPNLPFYRYVPKTRRAQYNEQGQLVGYDEQFDPGFGGHVAMALGRAGQFFTDYLLKPGTDMVSGVFRAAGAPEVADQITTSDWYTKLNEYSHFDPYQETDSFFSGGGATLMATDLGMYIASALNVGRVATGIAGGAFAASAGRAASAANTARLQFLAGKFMQNPVTPTLAQARALKTAQVISSGQTGTFLNIELGAAGLEAIGGQNRSLLANPLVDNIFDSIGVQTEIEKAYMTSNNLTRAGLDAMSSIGAMLIFDNVWAGIKYGGNLARAAKGKTSRGLTQLDSGDFEKVATPQFAPEWRRVLHNSLNGLQEMPIGTIVDSKLNLYTGREILKNAENIETLSDAMAVMNHGLSDFFAPLRDDIEKTVRYYDEKFGGAIRYSDEQLQQRVDKLYQEVFDNIADRTVQIFKEQGSPEKRDLIRTMTSAMSESGGSVRSLAYYDDSDVRFLMSQEEANTLKLQHPNTFVSPVEQPDGTIRYTVNQVDEGFWGVRLAQAINDRYNKLSADDVVARNARAKGIDPNNPTKEQTQVIEDLNARAQMAIGREVVYNNERGYIASFSDNGYIIRTVDGNVHKGVKLDDSFFTGTTVDNRPLLDQARSNIRLMQEQGADMLGQLNQPQRLLGPGPVSDDDTVQLLRNHFREQATAPQLLADLDSGMPLDSVLGRLRQYGVSETEVRSILNADIDSRIAKQTADLQRVRNDQRLKPETRAARAQEISDQIQVLRASQQDNDNRLAQVYRTADTKVQADEALLARQTVESLGDDPVRTLGQRWTNAMSTARKAANEARLVIGKRARLMVPNAEDPIRQAYGLGRGMLNQIRQGVEGTFELSKTAVRNTMMSLGTDNNLLDNAAKVAYNKGNIKPYVPGSDLKKGTLVVDRGQLFMARSNVKGTEKSISELAPTTWMFGADGKLHLNPYWASIEPNHTIDPITGQLGRFVKEGQGSYGTIYRPATASDPLENQVYLNIQRPTNKVPGSLQDVFEKDIDGIVRTRFGNKTYEVFNDTDQAISVTRASEFDGSMAARRKEILEMKECR